MPKRPALVLDVPGDGLDWSDVVRRVPGATLDARMVGVQVRPGSYAVRVLQRVRGLPPAVLDQVRARLQQRYPDVGFEVLEPPGPDGVLVRTTLDVQAFESPALRFVLRFHDQARDILIHLEGDRMCVRATPLQPDLLPEMRSRIEAFLVKQGLQGRATVRVDGPCPCRDPAPGTPA